ncbi:hypothetical protein CPLU01_16097 [Colletotrichum plurivorum]|uniref:Uncharacterized protein n=1 Tax=Colletotrichum plurivorum TaxID=2175906 RepID=A0A8H6IZR0_9PEZI|nr:hypothetical protein CPLU01_16097 [Colletotrichum plurivorum]
MVRNLSFRREYVEATGAPASDAWWTCELYDKDLRLRPREDLLRTFRELRSAIKRPDDFIGMVFNCQDDIWTERCGRIIKDQ